MRKSKEYSYRINLLFFQKTNILLFLILFGYSKPVQSQDNNIGVTIINTITIIDSIAENKIWQGFKPQKYIYKLTDSLQNVFGLGLSPNAHSPNREQRAILINNYLKNISSESAVSLTIHEAFHSFQEAISSAGNKWHSENPSVLKDYDELSARNNTLLNIEGELLFDALLASSQDSLINKLGYFIAVRKLRQKELGNRLTEFEKGVESNEGLAEYVGVKSILLALDSSIYPHLPMQFNETDKNKYITDTYERLKNLSSIKRNIRRRYYYTGSAQALLLDKIQPSWKLNYQQGNKALQELIEGFVQLESNQNFDVNTVLDLYDFNKKVTEEQSNIDIKRTQNLALLDSLMNKKSGQIIINVSSLEKMGNYLNFDPMNMVSVDKKNKIHPLLSANIDNYFIFESNNTVIENIDNFEYIINSSFDKTVSIIVDNKEIGVSSTKPLSFKQLDINSSHFSLEASNGIIQIENNQLIITIIKR